HRHVGALWAVAAVYPLRQPGDGGQALLNSHPLPLAAAQARLGKPGRPRKHRENGHVDGQVATRGPQPRSEANRNPDDEGAGVRPAPVPPAAVVTVPPALLGLEAAGLYLGGLSVWTLRDYIAAGLLRPVPLPSPSGKP